MKDENKKESTREKAKINNIFLNVFQHYKGSIRLLFILFAIFLFTFFILVIFDKYKISSIINLIKSPNSENVIGSLLANAGGEIILGLLGIVITVVAIIVELAANRYTAKVSDLFVRDKVNLSFLILLSTTSMNLVFILYFSRANKTPQVLINLTVITMTACILTLVPYFIYVFKFLEPNSIISKIEKDILKNAKMASRLIIGKNKLIRKKIDSYQSHIVQNADQLTDIILNSIQKKDKVLATNCIKSISNFCINYLQIKSSKNYQNEWFDPCYYVRYNNADFVTLTDYSFKIIIEERTWIEHKLFRQLKTTFYEALNKASDICSFTAQCFYLIGIKAIKVGDMNVCKLVIKFFNTLLRASINAMDVRTCFNLLNQYRLFGEFLIETGNEKLLIDIVYYFKYYGLIAKDDKNIPFILEAVAHDLCELCKKAYLYGLDKKSEILDLILTIDNPLEGEREVSTLRGIRKAQIILATFFMNQNGKDAENKAYRILFDITEEIDNANGGYERFYSIIKELKYLKSEYWEIIDRGTNIDYIPDNQKKHLHDLLNWMNIRAILLFSYMETKKNDNNKILNDFKSVINKLPVETPLELKEFEKIYGVKGIDNRENVYNNILLLIKKLLKVEYLKEEIIKYNDFKDLKLNVKILNGFINGIKIFAKKYKKIW